MTDETIKDLFYGNLNLFDRPMHRNEEYNTALQVAAEARDALEATMTDEQKKLLDAYVSLLQEIACPHHYLRDQEAYYRDQNLALFQG